MLTPIQRVPRYQLLLDDYLKRLPEDSPDYLATTKAVEQIKVAASHSNETIQKNVCLVFLLSFKLYRVVKKPGILEKS